MSIALVPTWLQEFEKEAGYMKEKCSHPKGSVFENSVKNGNSTVCPICLRNGRVVELGRWAYD